MTQRFYYTLILVCMFTLCQEALSFRANIGSVSRLATKFYGKGGTIPRSDDKVRVELLADVERIGYKGDILKVSKEQWMNILLPKKASQIVHDHEIDKIDKAMHVMAVRRQGEREELMRLITALPPIEIEEFAGRNDKLYKPMTVKTMMDLLKKLLDPIHVARMTVKEVALHDVQIWKEDLKKFVNFNFKALNEIRVAGLFKVILKLKASDDLVSYQIRIIPTEPDIFNTKKTTKSTK